MHSSVDDRQLELLRAKPGDVAPCDARGLMSWAFFFLAKASTIRPIVEVTAP